MDQVEEDLKRMRITGWREREQRIERSGLKLLNKPRPTQGCRVNRRWAESHLKKKLTRFTVSAI
jgi:hypothetical protein